MKRTPLKRTPWVKKPTMPLKRGKLRMRGASEPSVIKEKIQATARQIVIIRDGGCIFRDIYHKHSLPPCNGYRKDGEMILQADHLITRSNASTYADTRLIVCLCKGHHGWKSVGSNMRKAQYDEIVKKILSKERVKLWEKCEGDMWKSKSLGPKTDLRLELVALEQELSQLTQ